ncbi:MAG: Uma2 family endonuclease [Oscillospiraceae bacterium]|nr:Uma2 family endonuclease [Oscillospiraceae bacterium]
MCLFDMNKHEKNVFQPDIIVVCEEKEKKLEDGKCCNGVPDFVIEILSPSTAARDTLYKFEKYLQSGVSEYWIVDPRRRSGVCSVI